MEKKRAPSTEKSESMLLKRKEHPQLCKKSNTRYGATVYCKYTHLCQMHYFIALQKQKGTKFQSSINLLHLSMLKHWLIFDIFIKI